MYSLAYDLDVDCELSLNDIHSSVDTMLNVIREKHEKVDTIFGDVAYLRRVANDVLLPVNEKVGLSKIATMGHLKMLLAACVRPSPPNSAIRKGRVPTPPTKLRPLPRAMSEGRIEVEGKAVSLPPLKPKCFSANQTHRVVQNNENAPNEVVLLPINVNKTYRTILHSASPGNRDAVMKTVPADHAPKTQLITARRERLLRRQKNERRDTENSQDPPDIKHFELSRFVEDIERETTVLQETFSSFTQRVLVPLQTFCKQCPGGAVSSKKDSNSGDESKKSSAKESLDKTEFRIVQTMNQIRQLLWPSDNTGLPVHLFCDDHYSKQVADEIDCVKYPVIRLVPDILQKFNEVITLASMWLKRDVLYVQNAKSALQRAHRRFLKTERLWRQARDSQRRLRADYETILSELQTHSARLHAVNEDINHLKGELEKSRKTKKILEDKLKGVEDNVENLVAKHKSLRKKVIVLLTKLEARERSHGFLESRVLSLKADRDAVDEKLRISQEYTNNLQNKMEELYGIRDAWSRRFEEKTDPDKLRARLEQARIRMPLPSLREKTFILRTGMENLRRAVDLVDRRLSGNDVHWSKLCDELSWPDDDKRSGLPDINAGQGFIAGPDSTAEKIKTRVRSAHPGNERQQRGLMLRLWMEKNGKDATLEKLLQALRASDVSSIADSVEMHIT